MFTPSRPNTLMRDRSTATRSSKGTCSVALWPLPRAQARQRSRSTVGRRTATPRWLACAMPARCCWPRCVHTAFSVVVFLVGEVLLAAVRAVVVCLGRAFCRLLVDLCVALTRDAPHTRLSCTPCQSMELWERIMTCMYSTELLSTSDTKSTYIPYIYIK